MQMNELSSKLKTNAEKHSILIFGLVGIVFYKLWKYLIFFLFKENIVEDVYVFTQMKFNIYRIVASFVGLFLLKKIYTDLKKEFFLGNRKIFFTNVLLLIPLYFVARLMLFRSSFNVKDFSLELYFNIFTGSFEEIFFRGIILIGISQYLKPLMSIFLTSIIFSLWHYDVVSNPVDYVNLFVWSMYAGICFLNGASLLSLILFHFLWDQVFFGFGWDNISNISDYKVAFAEIFIIFIFTFILFRHRLKKDLIMDLSMLK